MNEKKENFSAKTEIKADFNKILTKLINESPDRLKVLFDGEIKNNLIQPLFKKINESIDKSSITPQAIDFKFQDIIDDAVTNLLYDPKFTSDIKNLYNTSFTDIFKSFKDIDPKSFHKQFIDQLNKKIEKGVEDLTFLKTEIKLSDTNLFEKDEKNSDKLKSLTKKIIDQLEAHADKINISEAGITQDNLLELLFKTTPAFTRDNKQKYTSLTTKILNQISSVSDNIKLDDNKRIDQTSLINLLFQDTPEIGYFAGRNFNKLRSEVLSKINAGVKSIENIKLDNSDLSVNDLINILFNDVEVGGRSFFGGWKSKYNSLRSSTLDKLITSVSKIENIKIDENLTINQLIELLFEDSDVGGRPAFLGGWKSKYNNLKEKILTEIQDNVKGKFKIEDKPLSSRELLELLFEDTEVGGGSALFGGWKGKFNELREQILKNISSSIGSPKGATEDEDAIKERDKRDHVNKTFIIHDDSLKQLEKYFLNSLNDSNLVKEATQEKRFKNLMSFLKEDLINALKESTSSSGGLTLPVGGWPALIKMLIAGAGPALATAGTVIAGAGAGYAIGKLIEPSFNNLQEEGYMSIEKEDALFKQGKSLVDLESEWLKNKARGNGTLATKERAAYDVQSFAEKEMKKADPSELRKFKRYAESKLGKDIFKIKAEKEEEAAAAKIAESCASGGKNITSNIKSTSKEDNKSLLRPIEKNTKKESSLNSSPEIKNELSTKDLQLDLNQPLKIDFVPLISHLDNSFNNFDRSVNTINSKLDLLAKIMSEGKNNSTSIIAPPSQDTRSSYKSGDDKNNIQLYRGDYNKYKRDSAVV
jgi:hypothetical protein